MQKARCNLKRRNPDGRSSMFRRFVCFPVLFFFLAGQIIGLPGRYEAYGFTVGEEREMGEKLLSIVRKEFHLLDAPDITQYITKIGREVLQEAGPQFFDYHFFVVKDKEFNAFAAPSGLIFFNSGLIEAMDHENELVGVMAHETAHVVSRHYANRIQKSAKVNIATAVLILAGIAMGGGPIGEALVTGSMAANASLGLKFSREDEEEADRLAFKWMREDDRDPEGMVEMLSTMRKISLYSGGNIPPYLQTHPQPEVRLGYVQDLLLFSKKMQYRKIDEFDFLRTKYRILTLTKPAGDLISSYSKKIPDIDKVTQANVMDLYGLALAYQANGEYAKAEEALKKVMVIQPDKSILKADLGVLSFEAGRYQEARKLLQEARAEDHEDAYASFYLARSLAQTGETSRAASLYEELLQVLPDYSSLYYQLGNIKAAAGDKGAGYYYLGNYYWYEGDANMARTHLSQALKMLPATAPLHDKAKEMLAKIERLEKIQ